MVELSTAPQRYIRLSLDPDWAPWALGIVLVTLVQYMVINFMGGKHRGFFTKELMQKHFGTEHEKISGKSVPKGGYPDCGNGLHSQKLTYGQWFQFNLAQRNAKNYLENVTGFCFCLVVLAIVWPRVAFILGMSQLVCRTGFLITYSKAPAMRLYFAPLMMLSMFGAYLVAAAACVNWIQSLPQ